MSVSLKEMNAVTETVDMVAALRKHGTTADSLARSNAARRKAKETQLIKIRAFPKPKQSEGGDSNVAEPCRAVKRGKIPYKIIYEGGFMEDTVIAVDMINWGIRQAADEQALKLLGAYPNEKVDHKHEGTVFVHTGILRPMDDTPGQGIVVPGSSVRADSAAEVPK